MKKILIATVSAIGLLALILVGKHLFPRSANKNAIVIMIDTLRADHLGIYGYKRNTTPTMDDFAKKNVRFTNAIAVAPWTPPSVTSILTGLSVAHHGHNPSFDDDEARKQGQILRSDLDLLPEILQREHFQTAGVSSNPWISKEFNFDQGFDKFYYKDHASTEGTIRTAKIAVKEFLKNPSQPFFLYVHILDPHGPYTPKGKYAKMFTGSVEGAWPYDGETQKWVNAYDGEIRNVDDGLGDFFSFLKKNNLYDDTAIVVVSDHGEQFRERGDLGHGKMLHIEEVHVPFLVKCNDRTKIVESVVSNMDVTPTVLDCLQLKVPNTFDGISALNDEAVLKRTGAYSSVERTFLQEAFTTSEGMRIILSKGRLTEKKPDWGVEGTYDLPTDPMEQRPSFEPERVGELSGYLHSTKAALAPLTPPKTESREVSGASLKKLETLGYINN